MTGIIVALSAAAMGVDYGWQPVAGGGIEYIIQVEPQLLDSLKAGHDIFSDLPVSAPNVRRYRITAGAGRLPHHGEPPPAGDRATTAVAAGEPVDGDKSADIDLSQLPGPVLGPAFGAAIASDAPPSSPMEVETDVAKIEVEPPHLAAPVAAAPLATRVAGYHQQPASREAPKEESEATPDEPPASSSPVVAKPTLTQLGLFASLGCNAFLLWVATGQRSRYRALLRRVFEGVAGGGALLTTNAGAETPRDEPLPAPDKDGSSGASKSPSA